MPRTAITILLALAACGPAAGPYTGGRAPSGPSTGSTGEPPSTATGSPSTTTTTTTSTGGTDTTTTTDATTTSGSGSGSTSTTGEGCDFTQVNPSQALCICDGIVVADFQLCGQCALLPCDPTDCEANDAGCWCHGYPAEHDICDDGDGSSTT